MLDERGAEGGFSGAGRALATGTRSVSIRVRVGLGQRDGGNLTMTSVPYLLMAGVVCGMGKVGVLLSFAGCEPWSDFSSPGQQAGARRPIGGRAGAVNGGLWRALATRRRPLFLRDKLEHFFSAIGAL